MFLSGRTIGPRLIPVLVVALWSTAVAVSAQRAVYRAAVDLVTLNVTVTAPGAGYLADLSENDFVVLEDNAPQHLRYFARGQVPLALALLIDTSASMESALGMAQEAAIGFVRQLGEDDLAAVYDFDSRVQVAQEFTNDADALEAAIRRTRAGGSTSLYNALYIGLKQLNKNPLVNQGVRRRQAIIVLSDGADTSSLVDFKEVLDLASRSDTIVYAIGLADPHRPATDAEREGPFVLRQLAQRTGGRAFFPGDSTALARIYADIRQELVNQYLLAYESTGRRDGRWRQVTVRVGRPHVAVRTRQGYYAARP
jgi:VWFA-related protein